MSSYGDYGWPELKSFGDSLKQAREERGVTLDAIAQNTRISRKYLLALESSDLDTLPGGAFDQGYIRTYSEFLGIDARPILEAYKERERELGRGTAESEQQKLAELSRLLEQRSRGRNRYAPGRYLLALLALVGLIAAGIWLVIGEDARTDYAGPSPDPASQGPRPGLPVPAEPETEPPATAEGSPDAPRQEPSGFVVSAYGVGTGVVDRQLVGRDDHFTEGTEVWFWTRVVGGKPGDVVRHIWTHNGQVAMASELELGGPHWRTYSRLTIPPGGTGRWSVEARAGDGRSLAREEFVCID